MLEIVYPKTWWFKLCEKVIPSRCREIPEATDPNQILLRQVAIWREHIYLQQFASSENLDFYHTHPWSHGTIAIGLYGKLAEWLPSGPIYRKIWKAPYFRYMGPQFLHSSAPFGPGHTSVFIGLGKKTNRKYYHAASDAEASIHWEDHIIKKVKRL